MTGCCCATRAAHAVAAGVEVLDVDPPPLRRRGAAAARAEQLAGWTGGAGRRPSWPGAGASGRPAARDGGAGSRPAPCGRGLAGRPGAGRALAGGGWPRRSAGTRRRTRWSPGCRSRRRGARSALPDRRARSTRCSHRRRGPPARPARGGWAAGRAGRPACRAPADPAAVAAVRADLAGPPFAAPEAYRLAELGLGRRELAAAVRAGALLRVADGVYLLPGADGRRPRCSPACRSRSRSQRGAAGARDHPAGRRPAAGTARRPRPDPPPPGRPAPSAAGDE